MDSAKNFARSLVATAPSPATTGTTLEVSTGEASKFPDVPFNATVWPINVQPTTSNAEIVRVTAIDGDELTIVREQEGTSARTIETNDQIAATITAKLVTDLEAAIAAASLLAAPIGSGKLWFSDSAPGDPWLLMQGQAISRSTYDTLFSLWGTTYGEGDGSTTFNVPDMRGRIPIGKAASGDLATLAAVLGAWDHTHGPGSLLVESHAHAPGTLTVASHTHGAGTLSVAAHTHGSGTLAVANHSHSAGTLETDEQGDHSHTGPSHTHTFSDTSSQPSSQGSVNTTSPNGNVGSSIHTHDVSGTTSSSGTGNTSTNGDHDHDVQGNTGSTAPAVSSGVTGSTAPAVNSGATAATSPAVGSGTTAVASPAVGSGVTDEGNPPVLVINFIVRVME